MPVQRHKAASDETTGTSYLMVKKTFAMLLSLPLAGNLYNLVCLEQHETLCLVYTVLVCLYNYIGLQMSSSYLDMWNKYLQGRGDREIWVIWNAIMHILYVHYTLVCMVQLNGLWLAPAGQHSCRIAADFVLRSPIFWVWWKFWHLKVIFDKDSFNVSL